MPDTSVVPLHHGPYVMLCEVSWYVAEGLDVLEIKLSWYSTPLCLLSLQSLPSTLGSSVDLDRDVSFGIGASADVGL